MSGSRIIGTLDVEGKNFRDSKGVISPLGISMLYGTCVNIDPVPAMDQAAAMGFEYGRVFSGHIEPLDGRPQHQNVRESLERIRPFFMRLGERGMWGQSCFNTDTRAGAYDQRNHTDQLGRILAGLPNVIAAEMMNEIGHGTQVPMSMDELFELQQIARNAGYSGPLGLGAIDRDELDKPRDQGGKYDPCERPFSKMLAMVHLNRDKKPEWKEVGRLNELRTLAEVYNVPGVNNEMGRADHESVERPNVYAYLAGILGTGMGFATLFHASQPRDCQVMSGRTLEAARHFIRGGRALPRGRYHFENGHWASSPVRAAAFVEGEGDFVIPGQRIWRAQCFRHDDTGQWYLLVYGPDVSRQDDVRFRNGFQHDQLIDRVDENIRLYTLKQ